MQGPFIDKVSKRNYFILAVSTFFSFSTYMSLTYLSVLLKQNGIDEAEIGSLLSIYVLPVLLTIPFAGKLIIRWGAVRVTQLGLSIIFFSYLSYHWTQYSIGSLMLSRLFHGAGYGLFFPSAMMAARGFLQGKSQVYWFGVFASMIPLSNLTGPTLAEEVFKWVKSSTFFIYTAIPALFGWLAVWFLKAVKNKRQFSHQKSKEFAGQSYSKLLTYLRFWKSNITIFVTGFLFGFTVSFISLFFSSNKVPVFYFFTFFSAALFFSRFILMHYLQRLPHRYVAASGIVFMTLSYALLIYQLSPHTASLAGVCMGLGFSVMFPILNVHVSSLFHAQDQSRALALFNFFFQTGIWTMPFVGGLIIKWVGIYFLLKTLFTIGAVSVVVILVTEKLKKQNYR